MTPTDLPGPEPHVDRPRMPAGYGLPTSTDGQLSWATVEQELVSAQHYWLSTVRPDGRPHVVPRWGVWVDGRFYYDGADTTVHARNLLENPSCSLHLESGTRVVIVDGMSTPTRADPADLGARLADAFGKYHLAGYSPTAESWADGGGLRVLSPVQAIAWFSFPTDATRFRFHA